MRRVAAVAHLALVGEPNAVKRAIDTKASGKNVTGNEQVMRLVREFDSGNAWAVAHVEAVTNGNLIPAEVKQQLPPVTWLAIIGWWEVAIGLAFCFHQTLRLAIALLAWLAFPVVLLTGSVMWEDVPFKLAAVHAGDWLGKMLIMAFILNIWRSLGPVAA